MGLGLGIAENLQWLAVISAGYLFALDYSNWRTNLMTSLLVPYIGLNMPDILLDSIRGETGYWIAFLLVVFNLFFSKKFPDQLELPMNLILLVVTAPVMIVDFRFAFVGNLISLGIGTYLAHEHFTSAGGVRKAFEKKGAPMTIGIILLFISPLYSLLPWWLQ